MSLVEQYDDSGVKPEDISLRSSNRTGDFVVEEESTSLNNKSWDGKAPDVANSPAHYMPTSQRNSITKTSNNNRQGNRTSKPVLPPESQQGCCQGCAIF